MARPQRLNETQIAELFDPPTEQRDLVRHFTLSEADLGAIRRCRGDHNRLGYALMLCYLRHPGRALRSGERPPPALLAFVAEQIGIKGGKRHEMPAHHNLEAYLDAYIDAAGIRDDGKAPLFRSAAGRTDTLTEKPMNRVDAWRMVSAAPPISARAFGSAAILSAPPASRPISKPAARSKTRK